MLLAVNLAVGGNLLFFFVTQHIQINQSIENAISFLEKKNIFVSKSNLPKNNIILCGFAADRDFDAELQTVCELFGNECFGQNLGGGMIQYISVNNDTAFIRNGGFCEITFNNYDKSQRNYAKYAKNIFEKLQNGSFTFHIMPSESDNAAKLRRYIENLPVFNSDLDIVVFENNLAVSGRLSFGPIYKTGEISKNQSELLVSLAQNFAVNLNLDEVINISDIKLGMLASTGQSGSCIFTPVWQISANNNIFYLNTITGSFVDAE